MSVDIKGIDELIHDLRDRLGSDRSWDQELAGAHKLVGERAADWARFSAAGGTRQQATAIDRIKGRGFPTHATIGVYNAGVTQYALGAFYGAKRRFGWYADAVKYGGRDADRRKQFPAWVGNSWEPAGDGGPYHVNSSLRDHIEDIQKFYWDVFDKLAE